VVKDAFPIGAAAERTLDRRRLLSGAGAAAALVVLGKWAGAARVAPPPGPVVLDDPETLGTLAVGDARALVTVDGRDAVAVRLDADTVVAFDRRCPHLGCPVRWAGERGRFECPCHRAAFDARTGAVLYGPPRTGLTPVPLRGV
jgi:Rieske Fe-S protein